MGSTDGRGRCTSFPRCFSLSLSIFALRSSLSFAFLASISALRFSLELDMAGELYKGR